MRRIAAQKHERVDLHGNKDETDWASLERNLIGWLGHLPAAAGA